jgi:SAM-dependent methyltransferase
MMTEPRAGVSPGEIASVPRIPGVVDALAATDWAASWRALVEARQAFAGPRPGYWEHRAAGYAKQMARRRDGILDFLEPWLAPGKTLIDVGAGTGRHTAPLAERLEWVTAVEPSEGMRSHIPPLDNVTVIASTWEEAEVAPADLVLCSHALYGVADVVPFLEKISASARERAFVVIRARQLGDAADRVARALGVDRPRQPELLDLLPLLRRLGIDFDVATLRYPVDYWYESVDAAAADCAASLGAAWDEARGRAWLESELKPAGEGGYIDWRGEMTSGVVHWTPSS